MQRVKITLSYDGNYFFGFQIQRGSKNQTVAGLLEKVLKKLGIFVNIVASGRTDRGVHASAQVIHIDIPDFWKDLIHLKKVINSHIHPHVHIKDITTVSEHFHARFSAKKRLYRYFIYTGEYKPYYAPYALHVIDDFDLGMLKKALNCFVGEYSFSYFKKEGSQTKNDIRKIYKAGAYRHKDFIVLYFQGSSFLRSQVRMMSAFALHVAQKKLTLEDLKEQLSQEKSHSRKLTPACGLYLSKIYY